MTNNRAYGFTILETVIAMLILAFLIFSIGILIPLAQTRIKSTAQKDMAYTIADAVLEQMQTVYWERIKKNSTFIGSRHIFNESAAEDLYDIPVDGYPPPPYPAVSSSFYSVERQGGSTFLMPNLTKYVIVVRSIYSGTDEELVNVGVDVYWTEKTTSGDVNSGLKKISVSTIRYKRGK
jgi:type II secretory pathway pseudopilin PulG